jgi:hypothetical protein
VSTTAEPVYDERGKYHSNFFSGSRFDGFGDTIWSFERFSCATMPLDIVRRMTIWQIPLSATETVCVGISAIDLHVKRCVQRQRLGLEPA